MDYKYSVERYRKSVGGKFYRTVRCRVSGILIEVNDLVTDTDEQAIEKAKELLKTASEL